MHPDAQIIISVLKACAAASPIPITERSLINRRMAIRQGMVRVRLIGIAGIRLRDHHHIPLAVLAEALRLTRETLSGRIKTARNLITQDPWKTIYKSLP